MFCPFNCLTLASENCGPLHHLPSAISDSIAIGCEPSGGCRTLHAPCHHPPSRTAACCVSLDNNFAPKSFCVIGFWLINFTSNRATVDSATKTTTIRFSAIVKWRWAGQLSVSVFVSVPGSPNLLCVRQFAVCIESGNLANIINASASSSLFAL